MNVPLDELYLNWLYELIGDPHAEKTYWKLAHHMYTKEFLWLIPNDDNRAEDGRYLREEFIEDLGLDDPDPDWMDLDCSMLEMLIALSRRLAFQSDTGDSYDWFWHLVDNLGIRIDDRKRFPNALVEKALDTVIWRLYKPNGDGGLFPLHHSDLDQRDVEIWFQLNEYLMERV